MATPFPFSHSMKRPTAKPYPVTFGGEEHALLFNYAARWAFEDRFDRPFLSVIAPVLTAILSRVKEAKDKAADALAAEFGADVAISLMREIKFRDLCGIVWAGLQHEAGKPSLEDVGAMLEDEQPALVLMNVMQAYMKQEPRKEDLPVPAPTPANAKPEPENPTSEIPPTIG
jgi:hypothetical protein